MYRIIEILKAIIEAFKRSKSGGGARDQRARRGGPPRCSECTRFLIAQEREAGICANCADVKDDEDDDRDDAA